jgi:hypothetical protein
MHIKLNKWLLLPPALALLVVLGPWQPRAEGAASPVRAAERAAASERDPSAGVGAGLPAMPSAWQVLSTLAGLLLLGGAAVVVLSRLRRGPAAAAAGPLVLRQVMRLSGRRALYAVQAEDRILVLADGGEGLHLVSTLADAGAREDDRTVAARDGGADEDGGAVLKDMLIPRPSRPGHAAAKTKAPGATKLADFRALLRKVQGEA